MKAKKITNQATLQPVSTARGNPNFAVIIAVRDWTEQAMPKQEPKHPELKRNEMFLMNVTPVEFAWFTSGHVHMDDFKAVRLGDKAYLTNTLTPVVDPKLRYKPMFGALRRGARLRRKEKKEEKKTKTKEKKEKKNNDTDKKHIERVDETNNT